MIFYFVIFLFFIPFVYKEIYDSRIRNSGIFLLFITIFWLLSFIRWETGTDWDSYLLFFDNIIDPFSSSDSPEGNLETGFWFIANFSKWISNSYTFFLFIQSTFLYFFLYKGLMQLSPYPLFSLFVYYSVGLGGIFFVRQTIALCILFYSITFIIRRNLSLFLLLVFLATLIHRSAIIFIIAYPIFFKSLKIYVVIGIMIACAIGGSIISIMIADYLGAMGLGEYSSRILLYNDPDVVDEGFALSKTSFMIRGLVNRAFVMGLVYLFARNLKKKNCLFNGILNIYIVGIILFVFVAPISKELARLTGYFDMAQLLLYPYILSNIHGKLKHKMILALFLFFMFRLYSAIYQFHDSYVPYNTILF